MNVTPRRPGTAQSLSLGPRMAFEASEALLWERQNNRVHAHLSAQMKELQTQHDDFSTRIQATEAVAVAAEAAIRQLNQMDKKIAAIEADERDRPLDAWTKESIGQLQVSVDSLKGVRQKLSGLETKVEKIGDDIESARYDSDLLKNVIKSLDVLESERREDLEKVTRLEEELEKLKTEDRQQRGNHENVPEETYTEVQEDDNPLAVFYGIDSQPPLSRQQSLTRCQKSPARQHVSPNKNPESPMSLRNHTYDDRSTRENDFPEQGPAESPRHRHGFPGDLQPPDKEPLREKRDDFDRSETSHDADHAWENTQLYRDMQQELAALRAMCQSQEPRSSNDTAEATQRLQETVIVSRNDDVCFSDATTEPEVENEYIDRPCFRMGDRQGSENVAK